MITYVSGILAEVNDKYIVIEAGGLGYGIYVPSSVYGTLPQEGSSMKLYTHLQVSEDSQKLYGFITKDDRNLFKQLIGVSGVGPKVAMSILSTFRADELRLALAAEDEKLLSRAPGLGLKTARKIILELKDKIDPIGPGLSGDYIPMGAGTEASAAKDAAGALVMLGFSQSDAFSAIASLGDVEGMTSDDILSLALKKLYK